MTGYFTVKNLLPPIIFTMIGLALCWWLVPREIETVQEYIIGFPDTDIAGQHLRPWLLGILYLLPAMAAWLYSFSGLLDRYLAKQFFSAFSLSMGTLLTVFILMDIQNNISKFKEADDTLQLMSAYYGINIPAIFIFLLPYVLLLSLLYCLGKMSRHQEIISMIQTGRSVLRICAPLLAIGFFASIICIIFNYHWGPWSEGYKSIIMDIAKNGKADSARSVVYYNANDRRIWHVGAFPYRFEKSGTIRNVTIQEFNKEGHPIKTLKADKAVWSRKNQIWTFYHTLNTDLLAMPVPVISEAPKVQKKWKETPWQIIKPGLNQNHLGIPDLNSWLKANKNTEWSNKLPYLTQWHYRFAQPFICLITILLAAPLGIVFGRRGVGGGVSIALFLSAGMLFCSTFFLTFGEAGHLPPILAAWGTNILFFLIAVYLFYRRVTGRPIYQSIMKLFPIK